jgi:hypothetical protein
MKIRVTKTMYTQTILALPMMKFDVEKFTAADVNDIFSPEEKATVKFSLGDRLMTFESDDDYSCLTEDSVKELIGNYLIDETTPIPQTV